VTGPTSSLVTSMALPDLAQYSCTWLRA
jgi:hypothetical protein